MAQNLILILFFCAALGSTATNWTATARKAERVLAPGEAVTTAQQDTLVKQDGQKKKSGKKSKSKKEKPPKAASVLMKRDVLNATLTKKGEDYNRVEVVIMGSGTPLRTPEDLQLVGNSGSPITAGSYMGFDQINVPFEGTVRFKAPNKLGTVIYDREVRFAVNEPGHWLLQVDL